MRVLRVLFAHRGFNYESDNRSVSRRLSTRFDEFVRTRWSLREIGFKKNTLFAFDGPAVVEQQRLAKTN